jgi:hypothetical protein
MNWRCLDTCSMAVRCYAVNRDVSIKFSLYPDGLKAGTPYLLPKLPRIHGVESRATTGSGIPSGLNAPDDCTRSDVRTDANVGRQNVPQTPGASNDARDWQGEKSVGALGEQGADDQLVARMPPDFHACPPRQQWSYFDLARSCSSNLGKATTLSDLR